MTAYKRFNPSLYANYLLIAYAFFLPISHKIASPLMIGIVVFTLLSGNLKQRFLEVIHNRVVIAFLLFYFMHLVWMIGSEHIGTALFKLKEFKYILYIIPIAMVLKKEFIPKIILAFIAAMFVSTALSYVMHFGLTLPFDVFRLNTSSNPHQFNVPFMESYTQYTTVLVIALGITMHQLLRRKSLSLYQTMFYGTFFVSGSVMIFLIGSRIGYSAYVLSILTVLLSVYKKHSLKIILLGLLITLAGYFTAYSISSLFRDRVNLAINDIRMVSQGNLATSLGARVGYHLYSYDVIADHLFFGVGTGDHIDAVSQQILQNESDKKNLGGLMFNISSGHNASLHSEYLDTLVQFGIIGLFIFLNLFYRILRQSQQNDLLKTVQTLSVVMLAFVSIGSIIFITSDIGKVFILLTALTLVSKPQNPRISY